MQVIPSRWVRRRIFSGEDKNVFVSEERYFPVEFGYRALDVERNSFEFPEGATVVEIPNNVNIASKYIKYSRIISVLSQNPLKISYNRNFKINTLSVPTVLYGELRRDFARIVDADQEQIIIKVKSE